MSSLSEVNLRVIHWLISASALSFSFLSACLGVHLVLLVLNSHTKLAQRIQPWYEAGSLFLGFAITHPILYLYEQVKWASDAQGFHISADPTHYKVSSWLTMWAWMTAACCFLAVISVLAFIKMSYVFPAHLRFSFLFASNEKGNSSDNAGASYVPTLSKERSREVFATSAWMLVFSFIPITTQVWVVAANMLTRCPTWLCVLANLIPATQGMLNLLVLAGNPALDDCQHWLASGYLRLYAKGGSTPKMGHMDVKAALTSRVLSTSTLAEK
ncbi:hypothetical protein LPJ61_002732 [Coemansia biformis]|uniref:Uncharacterized protein n=1 Tax=Coemansia biformis TaxID=1286918 RepID=A0A9W7YCR2_9FUNG|nr:hypothetical protein LPJ61_002732 [Coemansia biformis]